MLTPSSSDHGRWGVTALAALALLALLTGPLTAQESATDDPVTFTRDVAPILQQNCQICHRAGS